MEQREKALARRHAKREKDLTEHTRVLEPLRVGQVVMVQNQSGNSPLRWDKSGIVVETMGYDKYKVKMDGTGRMSTRNRRFLKPIRPYTRLAVVPESSIELPRGTLDAGHGTRMEDCEVIQRRSSRNRRAPVRLGITSLVGSEISGWGTA